MPNISSSELTAQFQTALREGWGYIYGAAGEIWTQAQQNAASREQTKKYGQKWVGHRVADCSGLFEYSARDCAARPLKLSIHSGGIEHACRRR